MHEKILIIEDEKPIAELISIQLGRNGYDCKYVLDGESGADEVERNRYDLILLDIMLPKVNGYELMEFIRPTGIPVIFLTARNAVKDRVKGLRMGADDYVIKPFDINELLARVETVLRRYGKGTSSLDILNLHIDLESRRVTRRPTCDCADGAPSAEHPVNLTPTQNPTTAINLTPKEFELMLVFARNTNVALTRAELFEQVWEEDYMGDSRTLDLHIQRLRKKLDWKDSIKTVYRIGYMLEEK